MESNNPLPKLVLWVTLHLMRIYTLLSNLPVITALLMVIVSKCSVLLLAIKKTLNIHKFYLSTEFAKFLLSNHAVIDAS